MADIINEKETDSVRLLRECDAGAKMAVSSIDEVLEKVGILVQNEA